MGSYLIAAIFILIGKWILDSVGEFLTLRNISLEPPGEFKDLFNWEGYRKYQLYLRENIKLSFVKSLSLTLASLSFILLGGFRVLDSWVSSLDFSPIASGLLFIGLVFFFLEIINLPFAIYKTFVIEEKYGFNRTTPKTFILDLLKSWVLAFIIGGVVLGGVLWVFEEKGRWGWFYCWVGIGVFQLFLRMIAPVVILPLFNKFIPIEEGELKERIEAYAQKVGLKLKGIFKIDASRRTTKSNAFFTGIGRYKRIALFDNLIQKLTPGEIISVLAHEVGHLKGRHILKSFIFSLITTGVALYVFTFFIENKELFSSFGVKASLHLSLVLFSIFYIPLGLIFSILGNFFSRRYEYQADNFAVKTSSWQEYASALKKLSRDNFSNLTPHPLKVFFSYSHPPILKRLSYIKSLGAPSY